MKVQFHFVKMKVIQSILFPGSALAKFNSLGYENLMFTFNVLMVGAIAAGSYSSVNVSS
jgi:hypothetical protein